MVLAILTIRLKLQISHWVCDTVYKTLSCPKRIFTTDPPSGVCCSAKLPQESECNQLPSGIRTCVISTFLLSITFLREMYSSSSIRHIASFKVILTDLWVIYWRDCQRLFIGCRRVATGVRCMQKQSSNCFYSRVRQALKIWQLTGTRDCDRCGIFTKYRDQHCLCVVFLCVFFFVRCKS